MEEEIKNLIKVWTIAITLISYSYFISSRIQKGIPRLISVSPVIFIFILLPLNLHSFHFCGPTAFFLSWLANFKLLLFSFDIDPFSPPLPHLSHFIAILSLPIKIDKQILNPKNPFTLVFALKVLLLGLVIHLYEYREFFNENFVLVLYCFHLYFGVEVVLALCSLPVRAPICRHFNDPLLSTSLQDFWGRRWNLMVPAVLRPTVYNPTRDLCSCKLGPRWARLVAMVAAFIVSGLMHELLFYYFTRVTPTWEVTSFFVLHGICTAAEVVVKVAVGGRVRLHPAVSGPLTLGFLMVTARWLMFPQLIQNGVVERTIGEYSILVNFVKAKIPLLN